MSGWSIIGDWGSSRLRLWRMHDGTITDRRDGPGVLGLSEAPADALRKAIAHWREQGPPDRITLCGMAGARGALHETAYAEWPLSLPAWRDGAARLELDGIPVRIGAGCAGRNPDGGDEVMRGEETQIFGALALRPDLGEGRQMLVLPGTHCKWAAVEDGRILSFHSFLTGELFALLQTSSLLAAGGSDDGADAGRGFAAGITRARAAPGILGGLFTARASQLRQGRTRSWAKEYLSGLLIGGEVAEMAATGALAQPVTLIGEPLLTARYDQALAAFGAAATTLDGEDCAVAGLRLLHADD